MYNHQNFNRQKQIGKRLFKLPGTTHDSAHHRHFIQQVQFQDHQPLERYELKSPA